VGASVLNAIPDQTSRVRSSSQCFIVSSLVLDMFPAIPGASFSTSIYLSPHLPVRALAGAKTL
jgi:hypothetical protein